MRIRAHVGAAILGLSLGISLPSLVPVSPATASGFGGGGGAIECEEDVHECEEDTDGVTCLDDDQCDDDPECYCYQGRQGYVCREPM